MKEAIEEVLTFFREWATVPEMREAFLRRFTPETRWENVGASRTVGGEEAVALLDALNQKEGIVRGEVIVHNVAAAGNVVHTERTDIFHRRSEEHTSELQSLMRLSYADFCLKQNKK